MCANTCSKHFKRDCVSICLRIRNTGAGERNGRAKPQYGSCVGNGGGRMEMGRNSGEEQNRMDMHVNMFYIENYLFVCCIPDKLHEKFSLCECAVYSLSIRLLCVTRPVCRQCPYVRRRLSVSRLRYSSLSCFTFSIKSNAQFHFWFNKIVRYIRGWHGSVLVLMCELKLDDVWMVGVCMY